MGGAIDQLIGAIVDNSSSEIPSNVIESILKEESYSSDALTKLDTWIIEQIDGLVDIVSAEEVPMKSLMDSNCREANIQLQAVKERSSALDSLWVVGCGLQEVQGLIDMEEYNSAASSLASTRTKVIEFSKLLTVPTRLAHMLLESCSELSAKLKSGAERAWVVHAVIITETQTYHALQVSPSIITLYEQLDSIVDDETKYLADTRNNIYTRILEPILNSVLIDAEEEQETHSLQLAKQEENATGTGELGPKLLCLESVFEYLHQACSECPALQVKLLEPLVLLVCEKLGKDGLRDMFPQSSDKLSTFELEIQQLIPFEHRLNTFISPSKKSSRLQQWVSKFSSEWIAHRENSYLDQLRNGLSSLQTEKLNVETVNTEAEQEQAPQSTEEDWNWGDDEDEEPNTNANTQSTTNMTTTSSITITSAVLLIKDLVQQASAEFPENSTHFTNALLLAYRALAPLSYREMPTKLIFINDVEALEAFLAENVSMELEALQSAAESLKTLEITTTLTDVRALLAPAAQFINCYENESRCHQAILGAFNLIRQRKDSLAEHMSLEFSRTLLGGLIGSLFNILIESVKSQPDIAATDCDELAKLLDFALSQVFALYEVDEGDPLPAQYIGSVWFKFNYLSEILKSSLIDLDNIYDESSIRQDFTAQELQGLVEALYQASDRRTRFINKIKQG